jgi:hypothetical protein
MKVFEITTTRFAKDAKAVGQQLSKDADKIKQAMRYNNDNVNLGVSSNLKGVDANYTSKSGHKFGFKSDFQGNDPELSWDKKTGKNSKFSASLGKGGKAKVGWNMKF